MLIDSVCTLLMSCFVSFARYMGPGKFFHSPLDLHPSSSYTIRRGSWIFFDLVVSVGYGSVFTLVRLV